MRVPRTEAPFIEGRAVVKGIARGRHRYRVQFTGDPTVRLRVVHPEYQDAPEQFLEVMLDFWRASNAPDISDYFSEQND
jgi:hypothetical protein